LNTNRVFTRSNATITLTENGEFTAVLFHGERKSGVYSESEEGDVTVISFTYDGVTVYGWIEGRLLNIPSEWEDGCGHGSIFTLR